MKQTNWIVLQAVNVNEYEESHIITAKKLVQVDDQTVKADGVLIRFSERIIHISKE